VPTVLSCCAAPKVRPPSRLTSKVIVLPAPSVPPERKLTRISYSSAAAPEKTSVEVDELTRVTVVVRIEAEAGCVQKAIVSPRTKV
jgi:hypothetical protein